MVLCFFAINQDKTQNFHSIDNIWKHFFHKLVLKVNAKQADGSKSEMSLKIWKENRKRVVISVTVCLLCLALVAGGIIYVQM